MEPQEIKTVEPDVPGQLSFAKERSNLFGNHLRYRCRFVGDKGRVYQYIAVSLRQARQRAADLSGCVVRTMKEVKV